MSRYFNFKWLLGAIVLLELAAWGTLRTLGWGTTMAVAYSGLLVLGCGTAGLLLFMVLARWSRHGFQYKTSQLLILIAVVCIGVAGMSRLLLQSYLQREGVVRLFRVGVQLYDLTDQRVSADQSINDNQISGLVLTNDDMVRSTIPYLGRFPNLNWIILGGDVTDESLKSLASAGVVHDIGVTLWGHKLTDDGLRHLCDFAYVRSVCINGPAITHHGLEFLMDAEHLDHLTLMEEGPTTLTRVNDAFIRPLSGMDSVRSLVLTGPGITDESIDLFTQLPDLERLVLRGTQLSADGTSRLQSALPRCEVEVETQPTGMPR